MKNIIGIIIVVLVLGGLIWFASPDGQNNTASIIKSNGSITVLEANNYDFGLISMAAGKVSHEFKIKNTSSEPTVIEKMYTSCMCTTATLVIGDSSTNSGQIKKFGPVGMPGHSAIPPINQILNPDEEATVGVVFDPSAHGPAGVGRIQRTVILENNAGKPVELQFAAIVTP